MTRIPDCKIKRGFSKFDIFAAFCFLAALAFLVWKAHRGTSCYDESFYLNVPYRLWQGDSLIVHEWHPAQLYSFLMLPSFSLFMTVNGSTDGVFLFFRLLFVAAQFTGAVYIYILLRRFQPLGALCGALAMMLYAPMHIMSLSYNTIAILMLSAACATMLSGQRINVAAPLSGLLFAGAVLCCPYLVLVYGVYSIAALVPFIRKKLDMPPFAVGYWLRFTAGCAVLAAAFLIFLLSRCSLDELFAAIPLILNDPEHPKQSLVLIIFKYLESFFANFYFNSFALSIPLLAIILAADKKRVEHRVFHLIPAMAVTAAFFVYYILRDRTVGFLMFPLNILGFFSFFLSEKRGKNLPVFWLLYIPGIMYSFCIHLASNLGLMSIGSALTVSGIASSIFIVSLFRELLEDRHFLPRLVGLGLIAALILQLFVLTYFRARYTRWDGDTSQLSITIEAGPQKGLITNPSKFEKYNKLLDETAPIRQYNGKNVVYLYTHTLLYLADTKNCGGFSAWMSYVFPENDIRRLSTYWEINPDKIPEAIFIGEKGSKLECLLDTLPGTWSLTESELGCTLFRED